MELHREPKLEDYGLDISSYENLKIEKKRLSNKKDQFSWLLLLLFLGSIFSSLFLESWIIFITGIVIFYFLGEQSNKRDRIIENQIGTIRSKVEGYEKSILDYYRNKLKYIFDNSLYRKKADSLMFQNSLSEFKLLLEQVKKYNNFLIFSNIYIKNYEEYLLKRGIVYLFKNKIKTDSYSDSISQNSSMKALDNQSLHDKDTKSDIKNIEMQELIPNSNIDKFDGMSFEKLSLIPPEDIYRFPRKIDWKKINEIKEITGRTGEEIVFENEKRHLIAIGHRDLAEKVRHVSKDQGDGLGYDILSYFPDGNKKYIEVKSTLYSKSNSFILSKNELNFLKENRYFAIVYHVFNVNDGDDLPFIKSYFADDILKSADISEIVQYRIKI